MRGREKGLTLIEMLAVLVIIGLIAAIVVENVIGGVESAKVKQTKANIVQLASMVDQFHLDQGRWPATLDDLIEKPSWVTKNWPTGGYLKGRKAPPKDGWERPFLYTVEGDTYTITSYGKDGVPGGDGNSRTLTNHNLDD